MTATLDRITAKYIALRDEKEAIEKRHKEELKPITEAMKLLEGAAQKLLDEQNQKSATFEGIGTAYKQQWTKTKVTDWEAALEWIREHDRWEMLTQAVNKTAVIEEMTQRDPDTNEITMIPCPVPGVEYDAGWKVNFRRS